MLNDAVYTRQFNIEERFNVDINWYTTGGAGGEVANAVRSSVMAGDDSYQLALAHMFSGFNALIADGLVFDFNKMPIIDLTKPWWNQSIEQSLVIEGTLLTAVSDLIYSYVNTIMFNKEILNNYNIEIPYKSVYDGTWTWNKLAEISKGITSDLNGDNVFDDNDQWGYSVSGNAALMTWLIHSNGLTMASIDENGRPTLKNMMSDKMQTISDRYYSLVYDDNRTYYSKKTAASDHEILFANGQIAFLHDMTKMLANFRDVEFEFGIVPLPKYDEQQESYYCLASTQMMLLPASISDPEYVGVIIEALSAESYREVVPALYEVIFENKYLRDDESFEIYNLIRDSLVYDINWNYGNGNKFAYFISNTVGAGNKDISSFFAANFDSAQAVLDTVYDDILKNYANN